MILAGKDVMDEPLIVRRELLRDRVTLVKLEEPIRESPAMEASLLYLIRSVKANGLAGLVAKRRDSRYETGQRSGAWQKIRVNRGQPLPVLPTFPRQGRRSGLRATKSAWKPAPLRFR
jgi:bifunctional non-homologous end joining protein LigD